MIIDDDDPHARTHTARMPRRSGIMRLTRKPPPDPDGDLLLRSVCHELRPPIATLSSLARAMQAQPSPDRRAEMARLATEYAAHAMSVLAEADAIAAGRSDRSGPARLAELLPSVAATVPAGRLSTLATPAAGRWPVHPPHTRQILINLVGNAARHSPGLIRLGARRRAGRLRLTVADEGGLNPLLACALRRATPPPDDRGLGLWVVRHLAVTHGGRLQARRPRSGGLVMEVTLPRYRP
jgi:two-component system, OmpR family, sensor kinase